LNQRDLAAKLQKDQNLTKRQAARIVLAAMRFLKEELAAGHIVRLRNFGTFRTKQLHAKIFQDVKTGKIRTLPDRLKVSFKPAKNILKYR
jgi:nucleoid DNA-binding protein